jgi:hypothetical protein
LHNQEKKKKKKKGRGAICIDYRSNTRKKKKKVFSFLGGMQKKRLIICMHTRMSSKASCGCSEAQTFVPKGVAGLGKKPILFLRALQTRICVVAL